MDIDDRVHLFCHVLSDIAANVDLDNDTDKKIKELPRSVYVDGEIKDPIHRPDIIRKNAEKMKTEDDSIVWARIKDVSWDDFRSFIHQTVGANSENNDKMDKLRDVIYTLLRRKNENMSTKVINFVTVIMFEMFIAKDVLDPDEKDVIVRIFGDISDKEIQSIVNAVNSLTAGLPLLCCEELLYEWKDFVAEIAKKTEKANKDKKRRIDTFTYRSDFFTNRKKKRDKCANVEKDDEDINRNVTDSNVNIEKEENDGEISIASQVKQAQNKYKTMIDRMAGDEDNLEDPFYVAELCIRMKNEMSIVYRYDYRNYDYSKRCKNLIKKLNSVSTNKNKDPNIVEKKNSEKPDEETNLLSLNKSRIIFEPESQSSYFNVFRTNLKFIERMNITDEKVKYALKKYLFKYYFEIYRMHMRQFSEEMFPNRLKKLPTTDKNTVEDVSVKFVQYNVNWIREILQSRLDSSNSDISVDDLTKFVFQLLLKDVGNEELEHELNVLLPVKDDELIRTVVEHRYDILLTTYHRHSVKKKGTTSSQSNMAEMECALLNKELEDYTKQAELKKSTRKIKPAQKSKNKVSFNKKVLSMGLTVPQSGSQPIPSSSGIVLSKARNDDSISYPYVFDSLLKAKLKTGYVQGTQLMLPEGTGVLQRSLYEEVIIPAAEKDHQTLNSGLLLTGDLDPIIQKVFSNVQTLNKIQSIVFDAAFYTDKNLLISAPTGAGKTNTAILTMLREIKNHVRNGKVVGDDFKIIYIAPMRALATEMTQTFKSRLQPLGVKVNECTGDTHISRRELTKTHVIVTTPEKWDLLTRKANADFSALQAIVNLVIIDEIHILNSERGHVIEAIVSRTLRLVESTQRPIRLIGLSATLPNYNDVATFLNVDQQTGLFYFDSKFRPVPLKQTFIGVKMSPKSFLFRKTMNDICYNKVLEVLKKNKQVMVFVHSRNETFDTAYALKELALRNGEDKFFAPPIGRRLSRHKGYNACKFRKLLDLFNDGMAVHHAGLIRPDRLLVERMFASGDIRVLFTTSTLAWGINLPAHAVIIKGTSVFNSKLGRPDHLDMLDVLQIFGRAGRPQFDTSGNAVIITVHAKLAYYVSHILNQVPIESNFISRLPDNLNAEVMLGTITNLTEAVKWLSYTYLYIRMQANPLQYGIALTTLLDDKSLLLKRNDLIISAARDLDNAHMIKFDERNGYLSITDAGRSAALYYIPYNCMLIFRESYESVMSHKQILGLFARFDDFKQIKMRQHEIAELEYLNSKCKYKVPIVSDSESKINILLQSHIHRLDPNEFSLQCDQHYLAENIARFCRGFFDLTTRENNACLSAAFLQLSKMFETSVWTFETAFRLFNRYYSYSFNNNILAKIESSNLTIERARDLTMPEIAQIVNNNSQAAMIKYAADRFPLLQVNTMIRPKSSRVVVIDVKVLPDFVWDKEVHGVSQGYWLFIECFDENTLLYKEEITINFKQYCTHVPIDLSASIPLNDLSAIYILRVTSDNWLNCETSIQLNVHDIILPENEKNYTDVVDIRPLPLEALGNPIFQSIYSFKYFNMIQTHVFHRVYHTDDNILLGAPTGSGKTAIAELAFLRIFRMYPGKKAVYIAPLKALVRERMTDWKARLQGKLHKNVVELTGDVNASGQDLKTADVIVTTPEKWDSISRSWQTRQYVTNVRLLVIDEIHMLGEDRGPVLEAIISRFNFISQSFDCKSRLIGLSTAIANCYDLGEWLNVNKGGLYNFRPSVRPVPLEIHIQGYRGKYYCPRMATMNKPIYRAIQQFSPTKPTLIFVSSRRQTRLTATDLVTFLSEEESPKKWLRLSETQLNDTLNHMTDENVKLFLSMGIGVHHAGIDESDRKLVEKLFADRKIQVLIATATLAWGVNLPAHLVIIKGAEYFDGKIHRYVDTPVTDIIQMMGRAGRPQFDDHAYAVLMVTEDKKDYYKHFLYESFPVESKLLDTFPEYVNAEIATGTIINPSDIFRYINSTYFVRRFYKNPLYYCLESNDGSSLSMYVTNIVESSIETLINAGCIIRTPENHLHSTKLGRIASYYYIGYKTVSYFHDNLRCRSSVYDLIKIMCGACEFNQVPVRHNEDSLNRQMVKKYNLRIDDNSFDSPHVKALILLQAHIFRLPFPCDDYYTDLKSVLDQSIRILQAMINICAEKGWLASAISVQLIIQMIIQASPMDINPILTIPYFESRHLYLLEQPDFNIGKSFPLFCNKVWNNYRLLTNMLKDEFDSREIQQIYNFVRAVPLIDVKISLHPAEISNPVDVDDQQVAVLHREIPLYHERTTILDTSMDYTLNIKFTRINRTKSTASFSKFSKQISPGWLVLVGDLCRQELLFLKRVANVENSIVSFVYTTPSYPGMVTLAVYVLSDTYLGIDQQRVIKLTIK